MEEGTGLDGVEQGAGAGADRDDVGAMVETWWCGLWWAERAEAAFGATDGENVDGLLLER